MSPRGIRAAAEYNVRDDMSRNPAKNVVYTNLRHDRLNDLDRVARYILAVGYSGQYHGGDAYNQGYVAARTVAVALHEGHLYVATNTVIDPRREHPNVTIGRVLSEVGTEVLERGLEDTYKSVIFIENPRGSADRTYHAEMQLIDFFHRNRWRPGGDMIGVSKPCCRRCAVNLDNLDVGYSYWHSENVGPGYRQPAARGKWW